MKTAQALRVIEAIASNGDATRAGLRLARYHWFHARIHDGAAGCPSIWQGWCGNDTSCACPLWHDRTELDTSDNLVRASHTLANGMEVWAEVEQLADNIYELRTCGGRYVRHTFLDASEENAEDGSPRYHIRCSTELGKA